MSFTVSTHTDARDVQCVYIDINNELMINLMFTSATKGTMLSIGVAHTMMNALGHSVEIASVYFLTMGA